MQDLTRYDYYSIYHAIKDLPHTSTTEGFFWDLEKWDDQRVEALWTDVQQRRKRIQDVINLEKSRADFIGSLSLDLQGGREEVPVRKRNEFMIDERTGRSIRVLYPSSDLSPNKFAIQSKKPKPSSTTGKFYIEDEDGNVIEHPDVQGDENRAEFSASVRRRKTATLTSMLNKKKAKRKTQQSAANRSLLAASKRNRDEGPKQPQQQGQANETVKVESGEDTEEESEDEMVLSQSEAGSTADSDWDSDDSFGGLF